MGYNNTKLIKNLTYVIHRRHAEQVERNVIDRTLKANEA